MRRTRGVLALHREIERAEARKREIRFEKTVEQLSKERAWPYGRISLFGLLFNEPYKSSYKKRKRRRHQRDCSRAWGMA